MQAWAAAADALSVSQQELACRVAKAFHLDVADLSRRDASAVSVMDESMARRLLAVPVKAKARVAHVATCDPGADGLTEELAFLLGRSVELCVAPPQTLLPLLSTFPVQGMGPAAEWADDNEAAEEDPADLVETSKSNTFSTHFEAALDRLVVRAIKLGASDLHIQATGGVATVRFRVDGVLRLGPEISLDELAAVLGRAKAVGGMDPSVHRRPQDGRGRMLVEGRSFDLRLSTIPASHAESLVIRILPQGAHLDLDDYGADPDSIQRLTRGFLDQTAGVFTVTGPTGSGKTSLLYAMLKRLNTAAVHIHTVEDPVEVEMHGLAQVQVNRRAGLTFAGAIRSILRQDPDVILVGETRDAETARAVTDAALTGHLVATTLHTIDAAMALLRFGDLGIDAAEIGEALSGISAQRLLRRLCSHCREAVADVGGEHEEWFVEISGDLPRYRARGCERCQGTGYIGRFPAVEVLLMDAELRDAVVRRAEVAELRALARKGGMRTMAEIAVDRAQAGDTDVAEIRRVMGSDLLSGEHRREERGRRSPSTTSSDVPTPTAPAPPDGFFDADAPPQAVLVTQDPAVREVVRRGALMAGVRLHVEEDVPAAAVWAEVQGAALALLHLEEVGEPGIQRLADARDAFLMVRPDLPGVVLLPHDDLEVEQLLVDHGFTDYLRPPLDPARVSFLLERIVRRLEIEAAR